MPTQTQQSTRSVLDAIRKIVRTLNTSSRETEKKFGISMAQLFILQQLGGKTLLTVNELAELAHTHQSSVSVVVRKLKEQGLVNSSPLKKDKRHAAISLTAKGRALIKRTPHAAQERFIESLASMSKRNQQQFAVLLTEFITGAGISKEQPSMLFEKK